MLAVSRIDLRYRPSKDKSLYMNSKNVSLADLTYLIQELNAALDTGLYDNVTVEETEAHIVERDLFDWLVKTVERIELSLFEAEVLAEINRGLLDIFFEQDNTKARRWGVERKGLCLLLAWINELIARREFDDLTAI